MFYKIFTFRSNYFLSLIKANFTMGSITERFVGRLPAATQRAVLQGGPLVSLFSDHLHAPREGVGSIFGDRDDWLPVLIAVPLGLGVGHYLMAGWLKNFAYRIGISWWFYLIPLFLILLITILTVSSQVLRTARINPAETLRQE